jgi:hypothetical protein
VASKFIAHISEQDYPKFQDICGAELSGTYQEWTTDHNSDRNQYSMSRIRTLVVALRPDDFRQFIAEQGLRPDKIALCKFAEYCYQEPPESMAIPGK